MGILATAFAGTLTALTGAAATSPIFSTKVSADATMIMIERTLGTGNGFIQVSNDINENVTSPADIAAAAAAATWKTLQRGAVPADVATVFGLGAAIEYEPFVCKAWRIASGTSGVPTTFATDTAFRVWKIFEI